MFFITGDTHGNFSRIFNFVDYKGSALNLSTDDVMIILGDAGINFYKNSREKYLKKYLSELPITLFCIHGNHEIRPERIKTYKEKSWYNGIVFYEEEYPNILFAKDGEVYDFPCGKTLVCGGAYSIDKYYRTEGYDWWPDEQPSKETKKKVEEVIKKNFGKFDYILTHTAPVRYEPVEWFLNGFDQSTIDKSTEEWLDKIYDMIQCKIWYVGHYHGDKIVSDIENNKKIKFMFNGIDEFGI